MKKSNPQGKGLVPVLLDWATVQPRVTGPKSPTVFLRDYCISSLVLAAEFRFKPVVGITYFLYARELDWNLSLIAPREWGHRQPGECLGECRLRPDMTWEINTSGSYADNTTASAKAGKFVEAFVETVAEHDGISANLPFYIRSLPYYQRLLATALASSLQSSMPNNSAAVEVLLTNAREWILPPPAA